MIESKDRAGGLADIAMAFLENTTFLKRFLTRYFANRQDIEDVVQETYLRAHIEDQKKGIEHPKAFLFRVAKNVALKKLSRKSRQITDYIEDLASPVVTETEASVDEHLEAEELLGLYCEAVTTLPPKCREVFLLRKVHGLAHKEIAERMNLSASSIDKYLRRGILACEAFVREREGHRTLATNDAPTLLKDKGDT
ncbi:MAG: RNA polymerase sigma factor [Pseudomonadota bacterium]